MNQSDKQPDAPTSGPEQTIYHKPSVDLPDGHFSSPRSSTGQSVVGQSDSGAVQASATALLPSMRKCLQPRTKSITMYHLRDGLFFARSNATDVCILKTTDGKMPWRKSREVGQPFDTNIIFEITVPENEWASVVCSVSVDGENHARWMRARRFQGADLPFADHELKDAVEAELTPEQREWMDAPMGPLKSDGPEARPISSLNAEEAEAMVDKFAATPPPGPTPRTDAQETTEKMPEATAYYEMVEHARALEIELAECTRERDEARRAFDATTLDLQNALIDRATYLRELNEARRERDGLAALVEELKGDKELLDCLETSTEIQVIGGQSEFGQPFWIAQHRRKTPTIDCAGKSARTAIRCLLNRLNDIADSERAEALARRKKEERT